MAIDRTVVRLEVLPPVGFPDKHCIEGAIAHARDFSVTDSSDTTAEVYLGGLIPWRVINESGGALTFSLYDAKLRNGTALTVYDQDGVSLASFEVADDASYELKTAFAGITNLVIVANAAADNITLVCKR